VNQDSQPTELPAIAVVTIGRNEGERLRRCLESIRAMNYPASKLEIIYVDSQSSDGSVEMARSLGVKTVVLDGPTTAARGRNAGWTVTSAPFVLFLDGDTILHPEFVRTALAAFTGASIVGVWGNRRELNTAASIYNAVFDLDWHYAPGPSLYFGGDALVRTEALRAVDGYNASLIAGEEPDMCRRMRALGYMILHIDAPMTMHDLDMHHFRQYWRRSLRTGWAYAEISSIYAATDDPLWLADSKRNAVRAMFWILFPAACLAAGLLTRSVVPLVVFLVLGGLLIGKTAWNVRRKTSSLLLPLVYGLHSHLDQIPIFLGQVRFWLKARRRSGGGLIEYR